MRSDEVHLYNGFIYLFIYFFWCFQKFDPKAKYNKNFCEWCKTKMESSQVLATDCCDLGTHCDRKNWWESRKEDIFLRGVIVSVFHNAQREDMSLVKQSVYWVQRGKGKEMHWLKCRILCVIKKKNGHCSEEYIYNPLTQRQRAPCRFDILNLHLEGRLYGENRTATVGPCLLWFEWSWKWDSNWITLRLVRSL